MSYGPSADAWLFLLEIMLLHELAHREGTDRQIPSARAIPPTNACAPPQIDETREYAADSVAVAAYLQLHGEEAEIFGDRLYSLATESLLSLWTAHWSGLSRNPEHPSAVCRVYNIFRVLAAVSAPAAAVSRHYRELGDYIDLLSSRLRQYTAITAGRIEGRLANIVRCDSSVGVILVSGEIFRVSIASLRGFGQMLDTSKSYGQVLPDLLVELLGAQWRGIPRLLCARTSDSLAPSKQAGSASWTGSGFIVMLPYQQSSLKFVPVFEYGIEPMLMTAAAIGGSLEFGVGDLWFSTTVVPGIVYSRLSSDGVLEIRQADRGSDRTLFRSVPGAMSPNLTKELRSVLFREHRVLMVVSDGLRASVFESDYNGRSHQALTCSLNECPHIFESIGLAAASSLNTERTHWVFLDTATDEPLTVRPRPCALDLIAKLNSASAFLDGNVASTVDPVDALSSFVDLEHCVYYRSAIGARGIYGFGLTRD
jgi:hypothetical protein